MHDNSQFLIMMPCLQRNSRIVEETVYHKKNAGTNQGSKQYGAEEYIRSLLIVYRIYCTNINKLQRHIYWSVS